MWGPEAERIGLVNHCVPADKLMDEAMAFATELANGASAAVRWTKMSINRMLWQNLNLVLEMSLAVEGLTSGSPDQREANARLPREACAHLRFELTCAVAGSGCLLAEAIGAVVGLAKMALALPFRILKSIRKIGR